MQQSTYNKWDDNTKTNKRRGLIVSLVFHALLAGLFLILGMSYPYPPPPEQGVLINFGTQDRGSGDVQPETKEQPVQEQVSEKIKNEEIEDAPEENVEPEKIPEPQQKEVATQETEEAPSIDQDKEKKEEEKKEQKETEKKPKEKKKEQEKPQETKQKDEKEAEKPQPESEEQKEQEVDKDALFPGAKSDKKKEAKGEGDDALFEGDKGQKNGKKDKGAYEGDESKGKGTSGIGHSLSGRSLEKPPEVKDKSQKTGKVVLEIKVDRDGNVLYAEYSLKGSTTQDRYLINLAKKAARKAKFNTAPNAPEEQWGKMTFTFRVQ